VEEKPMTVPLSTFWSFASLSSWSIVLLWIFETQLSEPTCTLPNVYCVYIHSTFCESFEIFLAMEHVNVAHISYIRLPKPWLKPNTYGFDGTREQGLWLSFQIKEVQSQSCLLFLPYTQAIPFSTSSGNRNFFSFNVWRLVSFFNLGSSSLSELLLSRETATYVTFDITALWR